MRGSTSKVLELVSEAQHGRKLTFKIMHFCGVGHGGPHCAPDHAFLQHGARRATLCSRELLLPFLSWAWISDPWLPEGRGPLDLMLPWPMANSCEFPGTWGALELESSLLFLYNACTGQMAPDSLLNIGLFPSIRPFIYPDFLVYLPEKRDFILLSTASLVLIC